MGGRPREFDDNAVIEVAMDVFWSNGYEGTATAYAFRGNPCRMRM